MEMEASSLKVTDSWGSEGAGYALALLQKDLHKCNTENVVTLELLSKRC